MRILVSARVQLDHDGDHQLIATIRQAHEWCKALTTDERAKALNAIQQDWFDANKLAQARAGIDEAVAKYQGWIASHKDFAKIPNQPAASIRVVNAISVEHERVVKYLAGVQATLRKLQEHLTQYNTEKFELDQLELVKSG